MIAPEQMTVTERQEKLRYLGEQIYACYVGLMRTMKGSPNYGRDPNTKAELQIPKLWVAADKAAVMCLDSGVDAETWVRAQNMFLEADQLYFNLLHAADAPAKVTNYLTKTQQPLDNYADALHIQKRYLAQQLRGSTARSVEDILLDDQVDFHPWFRIVCTVKPIPSVIRKYGARARAALPLALLVFLNQQKYTNRQPFDTSRITVR